jgi:hypothetical protein
VHGRRRQPSLFGTSMPRRAQGPDNIQTCVTASGTLMYGTAAAGWKHLKGIPSRRRRRRRCGGGLPASFRLGSSPSSSDNQRSHGRPLVLGGRYRIMTWPRTSLLCRRQEDARELYKRHDYFLAASLNHGSNAICECTGVLGHGSMAAGGPARALRPSFPRPPLCSSRSPASFRSLDAHPPSIRLLHFHRPLCVVTIGRAHQHAGCRPPLGARVL